MKEQDNSFPREEQVVAKLNELLHCGDGRIELSAAKEILAMAQEEEKEQNIQLEVTIRVIDGKEESKEYGKASV